MTVEAAAIKSLTASEVLERPLEHLHGVRNALTKVLWRSGESMAGILLLEPGASLGTHVHEHADHHAFVLEGRCRLNGEQLLAGSYMFVPRGKVHTVAGGHPSGCRVLYFYLHD